MRFMRNRAGLIATIVLTWHVAAMAAVSTAICGDERSGASMAMDHPAIAGHEGMVDCPMQRSTRPACPKHSDKHGTHECDCPTLGCSQTDTGFMAFFGVVGVLVRAADVPSLLENGDAVPVMTPSAIRLAPHPLSPPPRA
ncbi:MAG: hypothetical protein EHM55_03430 [Acidobacteria bacterium]|nr:MAG: hypothetical protein EHM55_03430 [Acidobacteriota bacterium]